MEHDGSMAQKPVDYVIANGEDQHGAKSRSFFIPSRAERESLRPGDLAKLLFEITEPGPGMPSAERMWVGVTSTDAQGYQGVLRSVPKVITAIRHGDAVRFGPEHVLSIIEDWPLLGKKILVSRRSQEQDLRPRWVYRETPDIDSDSGWRAMVGDESDAELEDPAGVLLQAVGFVLDRWPELRPVFQTDPNNGGWAWDERSGRYLSVKALQ